VRGGDANAAGVGRCLIRSAAPSGEVLASLSFSVAGCILTDPVPLAELLNAPACPLRVMAAGTGNKRDREGEAKGEAKAHKDKDKAPLPPPATAEKRREPKKDKVAAPPRPKVSTQATSPHCSSQKPPP
jgi:hypothetical protein